jgi:hypothetical protein
MDSVQKSVYKFFLFSSKHSHTLIVINRNYILIPVYNELLILKYSIFGKTIVENNTVTILIMKQKEMCKC